MKTVKMEFLMDIDDEVSLDAIKNLEHQAVYLLNLNDYPEMIAVYGVKVTQKTEELFGVKDSLEMYRRWLSGQSIEAIASDFSISVSVTKGRINRIKQLLHGRSIEDLEFFIDIFDGYTTRMFTRKLNALYRNKGICTKYDYIKAKQEEKK